jgi:hypothetical protein
MGPCGSTQKDSLFLDNNKGHKTPRKQQQQQQKPKTEAQHTSGDGEEQLASNDNVPVQREGRGEDVEE